MTSNRDSFIRDLILVDRDLKPLQARFEDLKREVRTFGPDLHTIAGLGAVTVSQACDSRPKGSVIELNLEAWQALPTARQAELISAGVVRSVMAFTAARAAAVRIEHFAGRQTAA